MGTELTGVRVPGPEVTKSTFYGQFSKSQWCFVIFANISIPTAVLLLAWVTGHIGGPHLDGDL